MKRLLLWFFAAALLFILFFIGLNLFDSKPPSGASLPDVAAGNVPLAENLQPGNGFFLLWGFAEPPLTEPLAPGYRRQVQELFTARTGRYRSRSPYGQWLARLTAGNALYWQGANFHFPQPQGEDVASIFASRRVQVMEFQQRFATLLLRYGKLLRARELKDFTPLNWECPSRSLHLATNTAKLFTASRVLAALDGQWPEAGSGLLDELDAGLRLIGSGRTIKVNALGRTMVELSLRALASLLNRTDCPPAFVRLMLDRLPERPIRAFGTGPVRACNWMSFAASLARVKKSRIVDPLLLKDYFRDPSAFYAIVGFVGISRLHLFTAAHALAAFLIKENESVAMLRNFWNEVGALENAPPWSWSPSRLRQRRFPEAVAGSFWWLRNPLGKMMVQSAVPYYWPILRQYVYRSRELQVRYDLARLLARARLAAGAEMKLAEAALRRLLAAGERDPFSGASYRFSRERKVLYSIGSDRNDDDGREQLEIWRNSDIALPIAFVTDDAEPEYLRQSPDCK